MKILMMLLALSSTAFAAGKIESIECKGERRDAKVTFNLEGSIATQLEFTEAGEAIAFYPSITAEVTRFLGLINYDFSLGGLQYFEFERCKRGSKTFEGSFLFGHNPLAFETRLTCQVKSERLL